MTKGYKVRVIPYSFWHEEHQMNKAELELIVKMLNEQEPNQLWKAGFDTETGDFKIFDTEFSEESKDLPLVNWKQFECFLFNQKNWEIAKRNASRGEDTILDVLDQNDNFTGTSYLVLKEHKFGENMSDLLKASKSPIPIPPPKGFG